MNWLNTWYKAFLQRFNILGNNKILCISISFMQVVFAFCMPSLHISQLKYRFTKLRTKSGVRVPCKWLVFRGCPTDIDYKMFLNWYTVCEYHKVCSTFLFKEHSPNAFKQANWTVIHHFCWAFDWLLRGGSKPLTPYMLYWTSWKWICPVVLSLNRHISLLHRNGWSTAYVWTCVSSQ